MREMKDDNVSTNHLVPIINSRIYIAQQLVVVILLPQLPQIPLSMHAPYMWANYNAQHTSSQS